MPDTPIVYEDVEVLEQDGLGFTVRIGNQRVFIGKYVKLPGGTVHSAGDRGRLVLPRWWVEEQGLPLDRHLSDRDVEEWLAKVRRTQRAHKSASTAILTTLRPEPLSNARPLSWRRKWYCVHAESAGRVGSSQ
jgi:hypothetical protein